MFVTRLAKSSAIVTRLRNPAMTTRSALAARQWSKTARLNSSCDAKHFGSTTAVGNAGVAGELQSAGGGDCWK